MAEEKRVKLEDDQANTHLGHKDRYGRTLAYIFLKDGTLLNAEIIRQGYGHAYTQLPFSRMEEFIEGCSPFAVWIWLVPTRAGDNALCREEICTENIGMGAMITVQEITLT